MASSVCWSLQYLNSARTQGGHLSRLTPSTVLRGGRNTASKYRWWVWGARAVSGPHRFAPGVLMAGVLPRPTPLRLQVAPQGNCLTRARVACISQVLRLQIALQGNCLTQAGVACISQAYAAQAPGCSAGELSDAGRGCLHFPGLRLSGSRLLCRGTV